MVQDQVNLLAGVIKEQVNDPALKGHWFEGGQMSLARRLPKRGFTNIFKSEYQIVNVSSLNNIKTERITAEKLKERD